MSCKIGNAHVCCTKIENLGVKVGNEVILSGINLHLHCGELTAVVGRNGAGKSTFMKALLNTIPHTGNIVFEGMHYVTTKPRFGYVPQSLSVEPGSPVSVEDLVLSCVSKRPVWMHHRKKDRERAEDVLRTTGAEKLLGRRVSDLSGGELQRVMLALAINPIPDILLLDEPVSGVDRVGLKSFYDLVSSLRRSYDVTIILVSHDLDLVARHADRVLFIDRGRSFTGTVDEIYGMKEFTDVFGHIVFDGEDD
ncbi:MAG: metal ABC transporter ATP-binding protein [Treponema sp.]|nr:metal ABC transporter ATP-binding protein [Treponema sp.]MBR6193503.1 metal ABC transporter ATP-binding protein [Treponema sp.]